jgi:putative isomerase
VDLRLAITLIAMILPVAAQAAESSRSRNYAIVQSRLQRGWNTWDTHTVTGQVLLPYGLQIRLGVKKASSENTDAFLQTALIGRKGPTDEKVFPGPHSYDGSYTELRLAWSGIQLRLETAHAGEDLVMLVTPLSKATQAQTAPADRQTNTTFLSNEEPTSQAAVAILSANMIWNRPGSVERQGDGIVATLPGKVLEIHAAGSEIAEVQVPVAGPILRSGWIVLPPSAQARKEA